LGPSSFVNHDCDANCEIESLGDGAMLKAIRKILPGDEITISYGPCYFGEENCMCRSCEKNCVSFYRPRNIENEIFEAAGRKQLFECNYCHRKFIYKSWLEGHIQRMHLMINYKCESCGAVVNRQDNLKQHTNSIHNRGENSAKTYTCEHCLSVFYDRSNLNRHKKEIHTDPHIPCTKCDQMFHSNYLLNRHDNEIHTKEKRYKCEACHEGFTVPYKLTRHRNKCQASHFE